MSLPAPALADRARDCAVALLDAESVLVAGHNDADGLTSAAVASAALARAGIPFETRIADQLDGDVLAEIAAADHDTVLLVDFGSGQAGAVAEHVASGGPTFVVADHHQPAEADLQYHCNPLLEGIDGASELSGAGATYLLARALAAERPPEAATPLSTFDDGNRDLAALAVVGAVGDRQADDGGLVGPNAAIAAEGEAAGALSTGTDLALYGTQTRALPKLLAYAGDVEIPGVTDDERSAAAFLTELETDLRDGGEWRRWAELGDADRRTVASALVERAVDRGVPARRIDRLVGTTYTLPAEAAGTALRDASEFATLLNATARYDRADVGLAVCLGHRDGALESARDLLAEHRRNISAGIDLVTSEGVTREQHVQWFDAGDRIRDTVVGIVAGMALGTDAADGRRPIVAFAADGDEALKVSARGTGRLVAKGLDLSAVMTEAAAAVDGEGGGHDVAAGATIPADRRDSFIERADAIVGEQLDA